MITLTLAGCTLLPYTLMMEHRVVSKEETIPGEKECESETVDSDQWMALPGHPFVANLVPSFFQSTAQSGEWGL
uniref:Putative secreted protein n=1 Tax=Anopheles darlingi TaxID=43151 RepID=A0A2M4DNX3_ANODA